MRIFQVAMTSLPRILTLDAARASAVFFRDMWDVSTNIGAKSKRPGSVRRNRTVSFPNRYRSVGKRKMAGKCVAR